MQDRTQDIQKTSIPDKDKNKKEKSENLCAIKLTTQDRKFLLDVYEHPTSSVTERYSRLGLSVRTGNKIQQALLNNDFLISTNIPLDKKIIKILTLTDEGRKALGISVPPSSRNGGPVHTYWKHRIAEYLEDCGYEVTEEYPVGEGKTIDLVAMKDGKRIAFEIETGNSDAAGNIQKCLDARIDKVVVVATSKVVRHAIVQTVPEHPKVRIFTGSEAVE